MKNSLPRHLRPKVRLFLSADIVGSTKFKQERFAFSPLFGDQIGESSKLEQAWPPFFIEFFSLLTRNFRLKLERRRKSIVIDEEVAPRIWKALGDEIIVSKVIATENEAAEIIEVWIEAALEARGYLRKHSLSLDLKLTAWTAGFPATNAEVAYSSQLLAVDDRYSLLKAAVFEFDKSLIDRAYHKPSARHALLNQISLELFYAERNNLVFRDFIGPSIDNGFRIAAHSAPVWMALSIELTSIVSGSEYYVNKSKYRISKLEFHTLKGVMGGSPYPIFFIDLAETSKEKLQRSESRKSKKFKRFKLENDHRQMISAFDEISPKKISKYCDRFFSSNRVYFVKPFIPKPGTEDLKGLQMNNVLRRAIVKRLNGSAKDFRNRCSDFLEWIDKKPLVAGKKLNDGDIQLLQNQMKIVMSWVK